MHRSKIFLPRSQFLLQNNARKRPVTEHSQEEYKTSLLLRFTKLKWDSPTIIDGIFQFTDNHVFNFSNDNHLLRKKYKYCIFWECIYKTFRSGCFESSSQQMLETFKSKIKAWTPV